MPQALRLGGADLPPGRVLHVHVAAGAGHRALIVADLLRRVAERRRRHIRLTVSPTLSAPDQGWTDYGIRPFESLDEATPDVLLSPEPAAAALCLVVPAETGDWRPAMADGGSDELYARLAMLEVPYGEPLDLTADRYLRARSRLDGWRRQVAEWATAPGRPMDRSYGAAAEDALADELDSPGALAVLDRLAADPGVAPGAKIDTFIHLDLLLGLNLVADIGRPQPPETAANP